MAVVVLAVRSLPSYGGEGGAARFSSPDYQRLFAQVWEAKPTGPVHAERMYSWYWRVAESAIWLRRFRLAEAAARASTIRWPHDVQALCVLSACLGKQGRFADALALAERARGLYGVRPNRLDHLRAAWLWHLDRKDEAADIIEASGRPKDAPLEEAEWLAMRAWYRAVTDGGGPAVQRQISEALKVKGGDPWRHFFLCDPAFDRFRTEAWFVALLGGSGAGPAAAGDEAEETRLIAALPAIGDDSVARAALATAFTALKEKRWDDALVAVGPGLVQQPVLVELLMVKSLAHIAKDEYPAAMDAFREISHNGLVLMSWTVDMHPLFTACIEVIGTMLVEARMDRTKARRAALALIVQAHIMMEQRDWRRAITLLDAAESWTPGLPEVPNSRGIAYARLDDLARAEQEYRQALARSEHFVDPAVNIGALRLQQNRFAEALEWFDRALAQGGAPRPLVEAERAQSLGFVGRIDEAVAILERLAIATAPPPRNLGWSFRQVSRACAMLGRHQDAERLTRRAIALAPEYGDLWTQLSGDLARQGRYQEAYAAAHRALVERLGDAVDARLAQAAWAWALGRRDEAAATVAVVAKPEQDKDIMLFHSCRAIFAAVSENGTMLADELAKLRAVDAQGRMVLWVKSEHFFARYRDEEWFRTLVAQWEAAQPKPTPDGKSTEPRL